jgi:hypothetical protein
MKQADTLYDNLKVARNAPPEVIRAAYKVLAQTRHPDRDLGNAEAERVMADINASYDVLSDPDKRRKYDLWVAEQERLAAKTAEPDSQPQPKARQEPTSNVCYTKVGLGRAVAGFLGTWGLYCIAALLLLLIWAIDLPSTRLPNSLAIGDIVEQWRHIDSENVLQDGPDLNLIGTKWKIKYIANDYVLLELMEGRYRWGFNGEAYKYPGHIAKFTSSNNYQSNHPNSPGNEQTLMEWRRVNQ